MSHVYVTGDTHGELQIQRLATKQFKDGKNLTKEDFLIITGDFGLIWDLNPSRREKFWIDWLNHKPWTTLFVDGNHENHARLQQLPIEEKFGGRVGVISPSIYHLRRGEIYTLHNRKFFCFGGAKSHDRMSRSLNRSYWEEEIPNSAEMAYANDNLEKHQNQVDYIITHTAPNVILGMFHKSFGDIDPTRNFLDFVITKTKFERFFCGHLHLDKDVSKYSVLWDRIIQIF